MGVHSLYRYSHAIGFYGLGGRGFNNPVDVAIRRDGMLYVLNRAGTEIDVRMGYKRVSMCTLAEEYHGDFSSGGSGDGQIMWPVAIALDAEENVYISDEALQLISTICIATAIRLAFMAWEGEDLTTPSTWLSAGTACSMC
jgi:hypothetical protein